MSFPVSWVDALFSKFAVLYGNKFTSQYAGADMEALRNEWVRQLDGFENHQDALRYAMNNLPADWPPTVLEFKQLARRAPPPEFKALPAPKADPKRVAEAMSQMARPEPQGPKAWAHRLIEKHDRGAYVPAANLRMAREALA